MDLSHFLNPLVILDVLNSDEIVLLLITPHESSLLVIKDQSLCIFGIFGEVDFGVFFLKFVFGSSL